MLTTSLQIRRSHARSLLGRLTGTQEHRPAPQGRTRPVRAPPRHRLLPRAPEFFVDFITCSETRKTPHRHPPSPASLLSFVPILSSSPRSHSPSVARIAPPHPHTYFFFCRVSPRKAKLSPAITWIEGSRFGGSLLSLCVVLRPSSTLFSKRVGSSRSFEAEGCEVQQDREKAAEERSPLSAKGKDEFDQSGKQGGGSSLVPSAKLEKPGWLPPIAI